jgi:hypothetical protein
LAAYWPARYIPGSLAYRWEDGTPIPPGYQMYVWQKNVSIPEMETIRAAGGKNIFYHCDPLWWWHPDECRQADAIVDAVVCSTEASALDYMDFSGRTEHPTVIPDRLELSYYKSRGPHETPRGQPVRFVWFGMSQNRLTLFAALANLERLVANGVSIVLTLIDDAPQEVVYWSEMFPFIHARWTLDNENALICANDIALVPLYPGPWGKIKTNNRTLVAWACGLPAITGENYRELYEVATRATLRNEMVAAGQQELVQRYDVRQSAGEWMQLLEAIA